MTYPSGARTPAPAADRHRRRKRSNHCAANKATRGKWVERGATAPLGPLTGLTLAAGKADARQDVVLAAAGNVLLQAAQTGQTSSVSRHDSPLWGGDHAQSQSSTGLAGGSIGGRDLRIESGNDTTLNDQRINAQRNLTVVSGNDLLIGGTTLHRVQTDGTAATAHGGTEMAAGEQLQLSAGKDLQMAGGTIKAGDAAMTALGDILLQGTSSRTEKPDHITETADPLTIEATRDVDIKGLGNASNVRLQAVAVNAGNKASIGATGDLSIDPGVNYTYDRWTESHSSGGFLTKKTTVTDHVRESASAVPSSISGQDVELLAKGGVTLTATQIDSGNTTTIKAGKDIQYFAAQDYQYAHDESHTSKSFLGFQYGRSSNSATVSAHTALATDIQSQSDVLSQSAGSTTLQGTRIKSATGGTTCWPARISTSSPRTTACKASPATRKAALPIPWSGKAAPRAIPWTFTPFPAAKYRAMP